MKFVHGCLRVVVLMVGVGMTALAAASAAEASPAAPVGGVEVRRSQFTLPWFTSEPRYLREPRTPGAMWPRRDSQQPAGERTFSSIILENEYLQVEVVPEISGVIHRVIYKPSGTDMFFREMRAKDWMPFWESGVKGCFPYREHCFSMEDQEASHRIIHHEDGAVTVAMWMEFSRHNEPYHGTQFGRYTNMLLSQHVTLRPGEAVFDITYRAVNPMPFRQGRRIWSDAFWPRNHTADGVVHGDAQPPEVTQTEWILPTAWVGDHLARNIRRWDGSEEIIRNSTADHNSVFALDMPHGFAGLWYPEVRVNRLRLWEPEPGQAAKFYYQGSYRPGGLTSHMYNFAELWGGTHNIMEGTEFWVGPGETYELRHAYTMIEGIGRVSFADRNLAVHVDPAAGVVEVVTLRDVSGVRVDWDGGRIGAADACGPTSPARFALPPGAQVGRLVIHAGDEKLLDRRFPLEIPDDDSRHAEIIAANDLRSPVAAEKANDQMDYGRTLAGASRQYAAGSLERGRVLYRLGNLARAEENLRAQVETDADNGEAWHLLGAVLLEQGEEAESTDAFRRAMQAGDAYPPAGYYLALAARREGDVPAALAHLERLIEQLPGHWEGRILQAWLRAGDPATAADALDASVALLREDPADWRAARVMLRSAQTVGDESRQAVAREAYEALIQEPGAARRVEEFEAATEGRYLPPQRLKQF